MFMMSQQCGVKKHYKTTFNKLYAEEFPHIISSRKGENYAYCVACRCDFSLAHAGRNDVFKHCQTKKHDSVKCIDSNKKLNFVSDTSESRIIRAECLFTSFIVEHNLPITCADHAGSLFRKMFPDSEIAKKYSCARTKTSAIIAEMEEETHATNVEILKSEVFSVATDGSNQGDAKLYPIVTFYNKETSAVVSNLLSVPVLEGNSTGLNVGNLLLRDLKENGIPLSNCLALSADNAPVMIGNKSGVANVLKQEMPNLIVIGCPCHLIDLAAEKAAACIPVKTDEMLVDIYYYLQKSEKRKEQLKQFQKLHDTDVAKILKHVCTRWLSLGRCLGWLVEQWQPLTSFFLEETKSNHRKEGTTCLQSYRIPKLEHFQEGRPKSDSQSTKADIGHHVLPETDKLSSKKKRQVDSSAIVVKKPRSDCTKIGNSKKQNIMPTTSTKN